MDAHFVVAATAAKWSSTSWLAGATGAAVGIAGLIRDYAGEAGPGGSRGVIRQGFLWLTGLLLLEAAAGVATAGLVVLLGVTEPSWIDTAGGWLLVGLVGPTVAAVAIFKFAISADADINLGLSLVYLPLRGWLIEPIDTSFLAAGERYSDRALPIYDDRAIEAMEKGNLTLEKIVASLKNFAGRKVRAQGDREEITNQLALVDKVDTSDTATTEAEVRRLVAFAVSKRYFGAIEGHLGKLDRGELAAVRQPKPPQGAIT